MNIFGRQSEPRPEHIETVVGPTSNLRGTLRGEGGVRIDGGFEGAIETAGNVVIGENARVVADISGRNVTVGGAVKGNIDAAGRLEILSTGAVYGDVQVQSVMIDEGGQFHGVSRMRGLTHPALAAPVDEDELGSGAEVELLLDDEALEGTARPAREPPGGRDDPKASGDQGTSPDAGAPDNGSGHGEAGAVAGFDLKGVEMDIEPVIPDSAPAPAPADGTKGKGRRRRAKGSG